MPLNVRIIEGRRARNFDKSTKVLVDIFRSTSSMPVIMARGASRILPTDSIREARKLRRLNPGYVLVGERYGLRIPGFDYNNSPVELMNAHVDGKTIVFTSTNGTRVLRKISGTGRILIGSFINAGAIAEALSSEDNVDIILSGRPDGSADEDQIFGEYLREMLEGSNPDFKIYADRVRQSKGAARLRIMGSGPDIEACLQLDSAHFALEYTGGWIVRL